MTVFQTKRKELFMINMDLKNPNNTSSIIVNIIMMISTQMTYLICFLEEDLIFFKKCRKTAMPFHFLILLAGQIEELI